MNKTITYSHSSAKLTREMETVLERAPQPAAYEKLMENARKRTNAGSDQSRQQPASGVDQG
ncbi:MAG TPA: hypothetical protein VE914_24640 [Candidatus Angelobacter sp.]|nr:hypothetical protein [Candidatus Angelobacter sp.]